VITSGRYDGSREQRAWLRKFTSDSIGLFVLNTRLRQRRVNGSLLEVPDEHKMQIKMMKELTWQYVIKSPSLAAQQFGQERAVKTLFEVFMDSLSGTDRRQWARLPKRSQDDMESLHTKYGPDVPLGEKVRAVTDAIAGMTDQQAILMYHRFMGITSGSAFDAIVV